MKKNPYFVNILLTVIMGGLCLMHVLIKTFLPGAVLAPISIPFFVGVSVAALVIAYYSGNPENRQLYLSGLLSGLTFSMLPFAVGWNVSIPTWKLFAVGTSVFVITDVLYSSIGKRISSGPLVKLSPLVNGCMLYLASQCFAGLL